MKLINPSQKLTVEFLKFIAIHISRDKAVSEDELFEHFGMTKRYMQKTLDFLLAHNIIKRSNGSLELSTKEARKYEKSESSRISAYYDALSTSKPFIEYCNFLQDGYSKKESAKLAKRLYELENSISSLVNTFSDWMETINISTEVLKEEVPKHKIAAASKNRLISGTFIKDELGDYFKELPQSVQDDLSKSITKVPNSPGEAVNIAGRALEDFFRLVVGKNENLNKANGIIQITNVLNRNKNKYPTKLNSLAMSIGTIRSMGAAHGVDKQFNKSWSIEDHTAYSTIRITLSSMKSYLVFRNTGDLII